MRAKKIKTINIDDKKVKVPSGLKKDGTPNLAWQKFKTQLKEYSCVPLNEWKHIQFLGYIFDRYSKNYGIDLNLSYSGPPSKCSEIYCIKRMTTALGTESPDIVKAFIDWMFDEVIIPKKMQIKSLAFFFTVKLISDFKLKYSKNRKITRASPLTPNLESIVNNFGIKDIATYGDLAFAKMSIDMNPDSYKEYSELFNHLIDMGFDMSVLDRLDG